MKRIVACSIIAFAAMLSGQVLAADYGNPVFNPEVSREFTPVEFGSGWYLRGDIAWNKHGRSETGAGNIAGIGGDYLAYTYNDALSLRGGFGFQVTPNIRLEATAEHLMSSEFSNTVAASFAGSRDVTWVDGGGNTINDKIYFDRHGNIIGSDSGSYPGANTVAISGTEAVDASYSGQAFMINGYFDLPTMGRFTPYVGAGGGLGRIHYTESRTPSCEAAAGETCMGVVATNYEKTYWSPAWAVHAGTAVQLSQNLALDVGYTYLNIGSGPEINYADGTAIDPSGISIHQVRAGLRYQLW